MAEEVGTAYVSLIPSMRGFSKMVEAELRKALRGTKDEKVSIPVKPEIDPVTGALRRQLETQLRAVSKKLAFGLDVSADTNGLRDKLKKDLASLQGALKLPIPTEPGDVDEYHRKLRTLLDSTSNKITQKVKTDVDIDRDTAAVKAARAGNDVGGKFLSGFGFSLFNPLIGIPVLIAAALSLPAVGAAVAAATLTGGALGALFAAGFLLRGDPELQKAVGGLGQEIKNGLTEAAKPLKGPFLEGLGVIRDALKIIAPDVRELFKNVAAGVPGLARGIGGMIKSFSETGALKVFGENLGPLLAQLGASLPDVGNALSQFLISVSRPEAVIFLGDALGFVADTIRTLGDFIGWLTDKWGTAKAVGRDIGEFFKNVAAGVELFTGLLNLDGDAWELLRHVVMAVLADILWWLKHLWSDATSAASDGASHVVDTVSAIPGMILAAIGNTATLLVDSGANIVGGLVDGIKSKLGSLSDVGSLMAGTIRRFMPFSPAKEGPLSGSGNPYRSGQIIAGDLAAGVESNLPSVSTAAGQLARAFSMSGGRIGTAAPASAGLFIDTAGSRLDELLISVLEESIRTNYGGDPDRAIGKGRRL